MGTIFGAGMFIFVGYRPMIDELLITEYEQNPSNRSDASKAHVRSCRQSDDFPKYTLSYSARLKNCKSIKTSESIFHHPNNFSYIYCIYCEKVKVAEC
jgi:hypothetical protein